MQGRASNPLARRIERWSPDTCVCQPARKTRSTEVMKMKGGEQQPAVIAHSRVSPTIALTQIATLFGSCPSADGSSMLSCPGYGLAVPR